MLEPMSPEPRNFFCKRNETQRFAFLGWLQKKKIPRSRGSGPAAPRHYSPRRVHGLNELARRPLDRCDLSSVRELEDIRPMPRRRHWRIHVAAVKMFSLA